MPFKYNALLGLGLDNTIPLDGAGKIPSTYLPSYVDDVEEYNNLAAFPATGETGKIYVAIDTGFAYRWSGSVYVQIGITAAAGATTQVQFNDAGAFGGDSGLTFNKTTDALSAGGFIPTSSTVPANGVYLPAANSVAVATNGTGRLFVDATGNVGVGTSSTIDLLTIGGVASPRVGIQSSTAGGDGGIEFGDPGDDNVGFIVYDHSVDALRFGVNASERLRITSAGLVGIGTSSPDVSLHVKSAGSSIVSEFEATATAFSSIDLSNTAGYARLSSVAGNLALSPAGTERLRITSAGLVGIGTTSPGSLLQLGGATNKAIRIDSGSSNPGFAGVFDDEFNISINRDGSNGAIANSGKSCANIQLRGASGGSVIHFSTAAADNTAPSERFRCDSSGRLLVGTSSARAQYGVTAQTQVEGTSNDTASISIISNATAGGGANLLLGRSKGGSIGSNTTVASGDILGSIFFNGANGTNLANCGASVEAVVDGTVSGGGAGDLPTRLVFSTTADGASSPTERMRIASNGSILFVATSESSITSGAANGKFINSFAEMYSSRATTEAVSHILFYNPNGYVGQISTTASATSYTTSSDYRLKENVVPLDGAIARLNQIPVHRFNFIADPDTVVDGFIAHEAQEVVPECVTGTKDEVDDDGNPVYQGIDQSKLVPLLTAALQEAIGEIESLKARLTAAGI